MIVLWVGAAQSMQLWKVGLSETAIDSVVVRIV